jgi:hypothetical protein
MAKKTTRKGAHKRSDSSKQAKQKEGRYEQDFDKLPVGSPVEHPDAVHQQRVEQLPTELQSIIVDLQNNRDDPSQLFPAITERIEAVRATVLRLLQGAHTAKPEAADQPPSPIVSHSTPTRGGLAVGSERPSARAARGAQLRQGNPPENNAQGVPPHEPPPQTPAAKQEPGAHA